MNNNNVNHPERDVSLSGLPVKSRAKGVYKINNAPPEALVIHCADPRFHSAFASFLTDELGLKNYIPIIIGGGIHSFGIQSLLPKNFKILWEQIKFFIKHAELRQIIIINHEDCQWYEKMKGYHPRIRLPVKGKKDLQTAAEVILKDFAHIQVRTFWAALDGDHISFSEITPHDNIS
jgi:hypothetical protein